MTKLNVMLWDSNEKYMDMLCHYVRNSDYQKKLNLQRFSAAGKQDSDQDRSSEPDLWLIHPDVLPQVRELRPRGCVLLLSESNLCFKEDECRAVHKYQALNRLLDQVLLVYREESGQKPDGEGETEQAATIVSVYSASGGCGKTTVAVNLSKQLSLRGKRVFYLNLEAFDAMRVFFPLSGDGNFAKVQYYLKTNKQQLSRQFEKLRKTLPRRQIDYFEPAHHINELLELNSEDAESLLKMIAGMNAYDVIVADLESGFHPRISGALAAGDIVLWLVQDDLQCLWKTGQAVRRHRSLFSTDAEGLPDKVHLVLNKYTGRSGNDFASENLPIFGHLPYIPQWKSVCDGEQWLSEAVFNERLMQLFDKMSGGDRDDRTGQVFQTAGKCSIGA